jgi:hypothetical protein
VQTVAEESLDFLAGTWQRPHEVRIKCEQKIAEKKDRKPIEKDGGTRGQGADGRKQGSAGSGINRALEGGDIGFWQEHREGKKEVGEVSRNELKDYERLQVLYDELEQECLTAVKYIEALKVKELSRGQREDLIGELSASVTHLRIQAEALEQGLEEAMAA